jgi:hypothetical protein
VRLARASGGGGARGAHAPVQHDRRGAQQQRGRGRTPLRSERLRGAGADSSGSAADWGREGGGGGVREAGCCEQHELNENFKTIKEVTLYRVYFEKR